MDELKQSVQLAVHEQKDPLLIYKFESFNLFKNMLDGINKEVISFLFKADLPQQNDSIQEAIDNTYHDSYIESKEEVLNMEEQAERRSREAMQNAGQPQQQVTETIVRDQPKINRNDNVTIKHILSGKSETMKFKKAEPLLASGEWVLVQE